MPTCWEAGFRWDPSLYDPYYIHWSTPNSDVAITSVLYCSSDSSEGSLTCQTSQHVGPVRSIDVNPFQVSCVHINELSGWNYHPQDYSVMVGWQWHYQAQNCLQNTFIKLLHIILLHDADREALFGNCEVFKLFGVTSVKEKLIAIRPDSLWLITD